jgi:hypothetical protein
MQSALLILHQRGVFMVNKRSILNSIVIIWILIGFIVIFRADGRGRSIEHPETAPTPPAEVKPEPQSIAAFKGITIGMSADAVRDKLGDPKEKGDTQDYYVFSDDQSGQIIYDAQHAVSAISFDFNAKSTPPAPKEVLGVDVAPGADGAIYKMIRFPKAGYWISYNRTAGDEPMISITMQKLP